MLILRTVARSGTTCWGGLHNIDMGVRGNCELSCPNRACQCVLRLRFESLRVRSVRFAFRIAAFAGLRFKLRFVRFVRFKLRSGGQGRAPEPQFTASLCVSRFGSRCSCVSVAFRLRFGNSYTTISRVSWLRFESLRFAFRVSG